MFCDNVTLRRPELFLALFDACNSLEPSIATTPVCLRQHRTPIYFLLLMSGLDGEDLSMTKKSAVDRNGILPVNAQTSEDSPG